MRHCAARWRNRKALAAVDDGDPRLTHAQVLALSVAQQTDVVLSVGGSMACPATNAMSSKSEFVIVPVRFELETRCWPTVGGKGARQIMGGNGVGSMLLNSPNNCCHLVRETFDCRSSGWIKVLMRSSR